jgi:hypothetical protein
VTVCKPETRTKTWTVCKQVPVNKTKTVEYTVCVPKTREESYEVTVCDTVIEDKTETYTVRVPVQVEKQVEVKTCKMVSKTVEVAVPAQPCATPCDTCK